MANPLKGDVEFMVGGKTYILRLSVNAICELEEKLQRGFMTVADEILKWSPPMDAKGNLLPEVPAAAIKRIGAMKMGTIRAILWAALRDHHPEVTLVQVGEMIAEIGGLGGGMNLVSRALVAAFVQKDSSAEDPQKPGQTQPATGSAS